MRMASGRAGILLALAMVLLAFLSPACSQKTISVNVDEIVAKALATPGSVVSYQIDYLISEDIRGEIDGEATRLALTMDMRASVDTANQKMKLDTTVEFGVPLHPESAYKQYVQELVIGRDVYLGIRSGDLDSDANHTQWQKLDIDIWDKSEMLVQQLSLLESAEPEYRGQEEVDGVSCDVLELSPDVARIMEVYANVLGDEIEVPTFKPEWVRSVRTTHWIARDSSRLVKAEVKMTLHLDAGDLVGSSSTGELDAEVEGEMFFREYNEPVSVELPPEAIEQTAQ